MASAIQGGVSQSYYTTQSDNRAKARREDIARSSEERPPAETNNDDADGRVLATDRAFLNSVDEIVAHIRAIQSRRTLEGRATFLDDTYLDHVLDDEGFEKVEMLLNNIRIQAKNREFNLFQQARQLFSDPSCLLAALRIMRRRRKGDIEESSIIDQAINEAEQQTDIKPAKAGINVTLKARIFGRKLNLSPGAVRNAYRDFVSNDDDEITLYEKWVVMFGVKKRFPVIDFMERALLTDIDANDPSCSHLEFGNLLTKLLKIKVIKSCDGLFFELLKKLRRGNMEADTVAQWILFLMTIFRNPSEFEEALTHSPAADELFINIRDETNFHQFFLGYCLKVPAEIFPSAEDKDAFISQLRDKIGRSFASETVPDN